MGINSAENLGREMETSCRGCHATLDLRVNGLIGGLVALLGLAVEIWRNGELAHRLENLGKRHVVVVPFEVDAIAGAMNVATGGTHRESLAMNIELTLQGTFFPFLQIAHETIPRAVASHLEHQLIV